MPPFVSASLFKTDVCVLYMLSANIFGWRVQFSVKSISCMSATQWAPQRNIKKIKKNEAESQMGLKRRNDPPQFPAATTSNFMLSPFKTQLLFLSCTLLKSHHTYCKCLVCDEALFKSPLLYFPFFFWPAAAKQKQRRLECWWATRAICSRSLYTHCSVFSNRMSRPHQRRREQSRSRSEISRIRADGRERSKDKAVAARTWREVWLRLCCQHFDSGGEDSSCTHRLRGCGLPMVTRERYRKHDPTNYSFTIFLACRNNPHAFQSVRKNFCAH